MLQRTIYFILFLAFCLLSCNDDLPFEEAGLMDGKSEVEATLYFDPITPATLGTSSRAAGDAIKHIENLCVLVYNAKGFYETSFYGTTDDKGSFTLLDIDQEGNTERPGDDKETSAESKTPKAKVRFTLDNGSYKFYAVANMGNLVSTQDDIDKVATENLLKKVELSWNPENVSSNNQMFGYFSPNGNSMGFDAPVVSINKKTTLYGWLRRAASKITIAFDGSHLQEGVRIHLKSVTIKHIPKTCYLGKDNTPGYKEYAGEKLDVEPDKVLYEDGETFLYCDESETDETNFSKWPRISLGKPTYGLLSPGMSEEEKQEENRLPIDRYHTETTPALYFYENMQGDSATWPDKNLKDKRQDSDEDGKLDAPGLPNDGTYKLKDDVPFGTYIEVEAYYDSRMSNQPGQGKIIYRFMLGKDVVKNYNAQRNYHYKLTLMFNGYANDVDWHIEYKEEKEMIAPDPYYISYLYDQDAMLPIRLKGSQYDNVKLKAEVIESNWFPDGAPNTDYWTGGTTNPGPWHGFLSLSKTTDKVILDDKTYKDIYANQEYYEDLAKKKKIRIYDDLSIKKHPDEEFGDYEVEQGKEGIILRMPFYTRAKQMIPTSGYTGNNPYVAYRRKSVVRITLLNKTTDEVIKDTNGNDLTQDITVYQVRRCVNPKGVWRSWNNDESFHVVMKILESEDSKQFVAYDSDGPWRATVEIDNTNLVTLEKDDQTATKADGGVIEGHTDSPMDFTIKFNDKCSDATQVRGAVILVEYNNYTCHHRILVRQGYAPLKDGNLLWHTGNMYSATEETESPLEEGSMFKFNNWNDAILAANNDKYGFKVAPGDGTFDLAEGGPKSWSAIKPDKSKPFTDVTITKVLGQTASSKARVATREDYNSLVEDQSREYAYGVLYGDGATETLSDVSEVYGYVRNGDSKRGMRGCFVYSKTSGNNLFFPIGATGYGRRKTTQEWYGYSKKEPGALQYAWRSELYKDTEQLKMRPLFYDVYRRPGGIYWIRDISDGHSYLDINYFTFEFKVGDNEAVSPTGNADESSAAFIRCVEEVE